MVVNMKLAPMDAILEDSHSPRTIIGFDFEMLKEPRTIIGVGITIASLINGFEFKHSEKFPLLHPDKVSLVKEDPFWQKFPFEDLIYKGNLSEEEMFELAKFDIVTMLRSKITEDPKTVVVFGTAADLTLFDRFGVDINAIGGSYTRRTIVLESLYMGIITSMDIPVKYKSNPYTCAQKSKPSINQCYQVCKSKAGKLRLHDCVDDSKNTIMLYISAIVGISKIASEIISLL